MLTIGEGAYGGVILVVWIDTTATTNETLSSGYTELLLTVLALQSDPHQTVKFTSTFKSEIDGPQGDQDSKFVAVEKRGSGLREGILKRLYK